MEIKEGKLKNILLKLLFFCSIFCAIAHVVAVHAQVAVLDSYQGVYSNTKTYQINNIVTFNGASYVSTVSNNLGYLPSSNPLKWTVLGVTVASGTYGLTALTGDVTATGPGSAAATLATVNSAPGACGDATHICAVTTDGKGRVTAQSAVATNAAPATGSTSYVQTNLTADQYVTQSAGTALHVNTFQADSLTFCPQGIPYSVCNLLVYAPSASSPTPLISITPGETNISSPAGNLNFLAAAGSGFGFSAGSALVLSSNSQGTVTSQATSDSFPSFITLRGPTTESSAPFYFAVCQLVSCESFGGLGGTTPDLYVTLDGKTHMAAGSLAGSSSICTIATGCGSILNGPLPNFSAKLAGYKHQNGNVRIMFGGDSTMFGVFASVAQSPGVVYCQDIIRYYGLACQSNTWFGGGNHGSGTYPENDPRIVEGAWAIDTSVPTIGVDAMSQSATGAGLTFTPTSPTNTAEIYYIQQPGGGLMTVSGEDGTTATFSTATTGAAPASMQKYTLTFTSGIALHTLTHVWASGGKVDLVGDVMLDSTSSSVIVLLAGAGASTSAQWSNASQPYGPGQSAPYKTIGVDLAVHEFGAINDWLSGVSPTTTQTDVQTAVTALEAAGSDVLVYTPVPSNTAAVAQATQTATVKAMRNVATANFNTGSIASLPIVDNYSQWMSFATHPSWYSDGLIHPNYLGYAINAQAVETATVQFPSQTSGTNVEATTTPATVYLQSAYEAYQAPCTVHDIFVTGTGVSVALPDVGVEQCVQFSDITIYSNSQYDTTVSAVAADTQGSFISDIPANGFAKYRFTGNTWNTIAYGGPNLYANNFFSGVVSCKLQQAYLQTTTPVLPSNCSNGTRITLTAVTGQATVTINSGWSAGPNFISTIPNNGSVEYTAFGNQWFSTAVYLPTITGTTSSIGGSSLTAGTCATGTATISGGTAGHTVAVSTSDGSDIGGDFFYRGVVTNSTTVTVSVCAVVPGTPAAKTYNISTY